MTAGDDLFESYRRYKWMNVDNPQYEPLSSWIDPKDLKRLKAKEYAKKYNDEHKWELKCKRLEKMIAELREEKKELESKKEEVREMRIEVWDEDKLRDVLQVVKILVKYL